MTDLRTQTFRLLALTLGAWSLIVLLGAGVVVVTARVMSSGPSAEASPGVSGAAASSEAPSPNKPNRLPVAGKTPRSPEPI
jgi:hypothetical protein